MNRFSSIDLQERLFSLAEPKYKSFMSALLPSIDPCDIIGVRAPSLRSIAKELLRSGCYKEFMRSLPHRYYEENNIHAFIIGALPYGECIAELDRFLPMIDNWGTCDSLRPKCFSENRAQLKKMIYGWLASEHIYTKRFAIEMLMLHYLGEDFESEFFDTVADIRSDEYYLNMMISWYFATALAERYEQALPYLLNRRLSPWVHNKTISKATESYRLQNKEKEYLKALRIKGKSEGNIKKSLS